MIDYPNVMVPLKDLLKLLRKFMQIDTKVDVRVYSNLTFIIPLLSKLYETDTFIPANWRESVKSRLSFVKYWFLVCLELDGTFKTFMSLVTFSAPFGCIVQFIGCVNCHRIAKALPSNAAHRHNELT